MSDLRRRCKNGDKVESCDKADGGQNRESSADGLDALGQTKVLPCHVLVKAHGQKGQAAFASKSFRVGDLVVAEVPLMSQRSRAGDKWIAEAQRCFDACKPSVQEAIMALHDYTASDASSKSLEGIVRTNSLSRGASVEDSVVCNVISRFNHSCCPSCEWSWDENTGQVHIYACRNIKADEEMTIYYIDIRAKSSAREAELQQMYNFKCDCSCCAEESEASDVRRARIQELNQKIEPIGREDPKKGMRIANELMELFLEEDLHLRSYRKRVSFFAYQFCLMEKDSPGAEWWIRRAHEYSVQCHGADHSQTQRILEYVKDPQSHAAANIQITQSFYINFALCLIALAAVVYSFLRTMFG